MNIGLIGVGKIGRTLAKKFADCGHSVAIANSRGPDTLLDIAQEVGATAVDVADVPKTSDVVIISVPMQAISKLSAHLFSGARDDLIIVDTGNYYSFRDGRIDALERGTPESRWVAQQLGRDVVKAFNSISADSLANEGRQKGSLERFALPVAGDVKRDKDVVIGLIEEIGFDTIDAGNLDDSWRQQPGSAAYCTNLDASLLRSVLQNLNADDRSKLGPRRDLALKKMMELPNGIIARDSVPLLQSLAGLDL
jgi:8-hydroxy-5-deazaflavin:NADPH oxidoreductase